MVGGGRRSLCWWTLLIEAGVDPGVEKGVPGSLGAWSQVRHARGLGHGDCPVPFLQLPVQLFRSNPVAWPLRPGGGLVWWAVLAWSP